MGGSSISDRTRAGLSAVLGLIAAILLATPAQADGRDEDRKNLDQAGQAGKASQADSKKATVVIGLATTGVSDRSMTAGLIFKRIDPTTRGWARAGMFGRNVDEFRPIRMTSGGWLQGLTKTDPTQVKFEVEDVNPGEWVLTDIYNVRGPRNDSREFTSFYRPGEAVPDNATGPRFKVEAGEVVYLGTFTLDMSGFPAAIAGIFAEPEIARQQVAPALRASLILRVPTKPTN